MIPSVLIYVGLMAALLGIASLPLPRSVLKQSRRKTIFKIVIPGLLMIIAAVLLPARAVVVTHPLNRLDAIMPRYLFNERHSVSIAANPLEVDRAIRSVTADEIRLYRALTRIRRLGQNAPEGLLNAPRNVPMLTLATSSGFSIVVDEPERELVLAVVRRVSIAINFRITNDGRGRSVLSTETRVFAPDAATRRRLTVYWRIIYPGSALIRLGWLNAIRLRAERDTAR